MQTIKSFSAIADLLRAKAKQRSDDDEAEPRTDDDEKRDDVAEDRPPRKKKQKAKPSGEEDEDKKDEDKKKEDESAAIAARIVHAGRVRRGEVIETNPPPIVSEPARHAGTATYTTPLSDSAATAMAAAIVAAARKARSRT